MKVDVEKLLKEVSKHPQIYNPDNRDFANAEIRDEIFNDFISKKMGGIKGEKLQKKWEKILNKYASFIRKLSNDDSSEKVLERFMEWPWTRHMRIFKPYVRKQFQIPEFQPAMLISEMNDDEFPDLPRSMPVILAHLAAMSEDVGGGGEGTSSPESEPSTPPAAEPREPEAGNPPGAAHPVPGPNPQYARFVRSAAVSPPPLSPQQQQPSPFVGIANAQSMLHNIVAMLGLDQPDSVDGDSDDGGSDSDLPGDGTDGRSAAKRRRRLNEDGWLASGDTDDDGDALPDLPLHKPLAERAGPGNFTAQEHTFLAWAKTMSTFTAKRQATVRMKINKIMSEAEFEDLDDEFFAANSPPRRSLYSPH